MVPLPGRPDITGRSSTLPQDPGRILPGVSIAVTSMKVMMGAQVRKQMFVPGFRRVCQEQQPATNSSALSSSPQAQ